MATAMELSAPSSPPLSSMAEPAMTYDEASMETSRHFMAALQELKNLRPQLYSAAEYCESSYLYSDQKQVVLDNLKDYSVKALVNAVDHLGTVAYKLNDLLGQQTLEISSTELRVSSIAQRIRTCQEFTDREGVKQQCLVKTYPRHHKHYVFPDYSSPETTKCVPIGAIKESPRIDVITGDETANDTHLQPQPVPDENKTLGDAGTLSWHLAAEAKATGATTSFSNGSQRSYSPSGHESLFQEIPASSASPRLAPTLSLPTHGARPGSSTPNNRSNKGSAMEEMRSLSSTVSPEDRGLRSSTSRSKSMIRSLLGRRRSMK